MLQAADNDRFNETRTGSTEHSDSPPEADAPAASADIADAFGGWAERSGLDDFSPEVLALAFLTWTRLHGIISLELGGHLAATGIGAEVLFDAEVETISAQAAALSHPLP